MNRLLIIFLFISTWAHAQQSQFVSKDSLIAGSFYQAVYEVPQQAGKTYRLLVNSAYGVSVLKSVSANSRVQFDFPSHLTELKGVLSLRLLDDGNQIIDKRTLHIMADTSYQPLVEALCGPKQILVGGEDYTAIIGTVLDSLDNPYPEDTPISFQYRFKNSQKMENVSSKPLYAYHRFFSSDQTGHPVISVFSNGAAHQEFELTLYANAPLTFSLTIERDHPYADGKQVAEIKTTRIADRYGNSIGDGSLVDFKIEAGDGSIYYAQATTIKGVASAYVPAPSIPMRWRVQASVNQYVQSSSLSVNFLSAVQPFSIDKEGDEIKIGPIKSFIDQWVAYRTPVELSFYTDDVEVLSTTALTEDGMVILDLKNFNLYPCKYTLKANCGGQIQTFEFEL